MKIKNHLSNYTLTTDSANNTLSTGQFLTLRLGLFFNDDSNYVQIGGVRLTLVTDY